MITRFAQTFWVVGCVLGFIAGRSSAQAQQVYDFNVLSPDFYYTFNDDPTPNPGITLVRGRTYTFNINTDFSHPFQILPETGVDNNNINFGVITYQVPTDAQDGSVIYQCSVHGFGNSFSFVDGAPPPVQIVSLSVSSNVVLTSTGGVSSNLFPEFNTDLTATNWFALTVTSNNVVNGTNEIICGRPPGTNVFIRIRSRSN